MDKRVVQYIYIYALQSISSTFSVPLTIKYPPGSSGHSPKVTPKNDGNEKGEKERRERRWEGGPGS